MAAHHRRRNHIRYAALKGTRTSAPPPSAKAAGWGWWIIAGSALLLGAIIAAVVVAVVVDVGVSGGSTGVVAPDEVGCGGTDVNRSAVVSGAGAYQIADDVQYHLVTVTLVDSAGRGVGGVAVGLTSDRSDEVDHISPEAPAPSSSNGQAIFEVRSIRAGLAQYTATIYC
jgi:hypothetical protein